MGEPEPPIRLTILHTGDEHGWIEPSEGDEDTLLGGAAELFALWRANEGYPNPSMIVLSSGDMWTGPAVSTWFKGESTLEVMNAMGYQAAALGNHELDFGPDALRARRRGSRFPFLAANVRATGVYAGLVEPFRIVMTNGIKLAVVGLAKRDTLGHVSLDPSAPLAFGEYAPALRRIVPEVRQKGADLVVVLAHECALPLGALAREVEPLKIVVMLGGHCHTQRTERVGGTLIVESGENMTGYSRIDLFVDARSRAVRDVQVRSLGSGWHKALAPQVAPDPVISALVGRWERSTRATLGRVLGYTASGLRRPQPLHALVLNAWLRAVPKAEIALSNLHGFRQDIDAGEVTLGDLLGVMPFENTIIRVELTGTQLLEALTCCQPVAFAGIESRPDRWALKRTGEPLDADRRYLVLINSYMYQAASGFPFARQDPKGLDTRIPWRTPVVEWILGQQSSPARPLEQLVRAAE